MKLGKQAHKLKIKDIPKGDYEGLDKQAPKIKKLLKDM